MGRISSAPTIAADVAWAVAQDVSLEGDLSEEDYLALTTNHLLEYTHGTLEAPPMPTKSHQRLVAALFRLLTAYLAVSPRGEALFAPYRVQLWPGKFREPDIIFLLTEHASRFGDDYARGADLVVEVVSPDDRRRDLETKRSEYAQAAIPEYWIVDPEMQRITVLTLADAEYAVHGEFGAGDQATSLLLPGFTVDVAALFAGAEGAPTP
jgi:Uma2 family endonuclease